MNQRCCHCYPDHCRVLFRCRQPYVLWIVVGLLAILWPTAVTHAQQVEWIQPTDGLANIEGYGIATAGDGSSVITGSFQETKYFGQDEPTAISLTSRGDKDIFVARYAADGVLLWAKAAGGVGADWGAAAALDQNGNSYITGHFVGEATFGEGAHEITLQSRGTSDLFLAKFDERGNLVWAQQAGGSDTSSGTAIAATADGAVYITGAFTGDATFAPNRPQATTLVSRGESDLFVARYETTGLLRWVIQAGGTATDRGAGIAADAAGNSYLTGSFAQTASFDTATAQATTITSSGSTDIFVARYSAAGELRWVTKAGGSTDDSGRAIAVDTDGNSTVTGSRGAELYVARYAADGQPLWVASAGSPSALVWGNGVAIDHEGNSYVVGELTGLAGFYFDEGNTRIVQFSMRSAGLSDGILLTYHADGAQMWGRTIGGANPDTAYGVGVDHTGQSYVVGTFWSEGAIDPLIMNGPGQQLYLARFASTTHPIVVNSALDPGDGDCNSQECTLREALALANDVLIGQNTIAFDIPGPGPHPIRPNGDLPEIIDSVIIDGYTQPGATPNTNPRSEPINAMIMIELDGSQARLGLQFTGNSWLSVVRGLAINRFSAQAISDSRRVVLEGNFIGTDPSGMHALGNGMGLYSGGGIGGTTPRVGGSALEARNLIAGNGTGIYIGALSFATIEGNFIGTDATGTKALGNGVGVIGSNCVGCELGRIVLVNNLISGNGTGVRLSYMCCTVAGNRVGTDRTGQHPLPNRGDGLIVSAYDIGIAGNIFAYNGGAGIRVVDSGGPNAVRVSGNRILANGATGVAVVGNKTFAEITANQIYANGALGIDLADDGVTANDVGDGDTGPNGLQNYPFLQAAGSDGQNSFVNGAISSTPQRTLTLEFFANTHCDPAGYGEGEFPLMTQLVTTDADGNVIFTAALPHSLLPGQSLTATATDPVNLGWNERATSEFSNCQPVTTVVNGYLEQQAITVDRSRLGEGIFVVNATFRNTSDSVLNQGFFRVAKLAYQVGALEPVGLVVQNAIGGPLGAGAVVAIPDVVAAGATFAVAFEIVLPRLEPFDFFIDGFGLPDGQIALSEQTQPSTPSTFDLTMDDEALRRTIPTDDGAGPLYLPWIQR